MYLTVVILAQYSMLIAVAVAVVIYHSLFVEVFVELFTAALFIHAG